MNRAAEIAQLAAHYGPPQRIIADLSDGAFSPFTKRDRTGEVCMVVQRPNGRLITAAKQYYPPGIYRLLTGGVGHGEPIEAALLREVAEETGLTVVVRRLLAIIEYRIPPAPATVFATFAFLLDEVGGILSPQDDTEEIAGFGEVLPEELPHLAAALEAAPDVVDARIEGNWRSWGQFRAVAHRVVHEALSMM